MERFLLTPKWIGFHLLVLAGVVGMIAAGFWQLDRLDSRREFNDRVESRIDLPPVPIDALLAGEGVPVEDRDQGLDALEWRATTATGTYLPDETFLVVNRSQNGRAGDNVVTPMRLADGRILVVNRGFVPLGIEPPPAPGGQVDVSGVARPSERRRTGQLSDPAAGRLDEVQRIDLDRLAPQLPGEVVPVYVDLQASRPAEPVGFPEPVIRPDLSEGSHLSYAVQWFIFATAAVVGWVLAVRRSLSKRRLSDATASPATADPPTSTDAEPTTVRR